LVAKSSSYAENLNASYYLGMSLFKSEILPKHYEMFHFGSADSSPNLAARLDQCERYLAKFERDFYESKYFNSDEYRQKLNNHYYTLAVVYQLKRAYAQSQEYFDKLAINASKLAPELENYFDHDEFSDYQLLFYKALTLQRRERSFECKATLSDALSALKERQRRESENNSNPTTGGQQQLNGEFLIFAFF
jgi:hypothetical protein